jgi:cyclic di-GMP phosphodiesterase Gmr
LSAVIDACVAAMVLIDGDARIRLVNQRYADLIGKSVDAVLGRSAWDLLPVEIGLALSLDRDAPGWSLAGVLAVPEQICVDAVGDRRRIAWSVRPVRADPETGASGKAQGEGRGDAGGHTPELLDGSSGVGGRGFVLATGVDVTRERTAEITWRERAHTDALTGLANRTAVLNALAVMVDRLRGAGCAVLFCDLDGFKPVNDVYGHAAGDQVLTEVARRLRQSVREQDVVARLGGDEFLVLIPAGGGYGARAVAARIEHALARPIRLASGSSVRIGVSIGVRVADPGQEPATVLHDADAAMYARKTAHRSVSDR